MSPSLPLYETLSLVCFSFLCRGDNTNNRYNTSIAEVEAAYWAGAAEAGAPIIAPISAGWDPSPREYIDLPWGDQV